MATFEYSYSVSSIWRNTTTLTLVIVDCFSATYMLGGIFQVVPTSVSETGIISDGPIDTRTACRKIIIAVFENNPNWYNDLFS